MLAAPLLNSDPIPAPTQPAYETDQALIDWLRRMGGRARSLPALTMASWIACQGVSRSADGAALQLLRALAPLLEAGRVRFHEPGAAELSFDEAWLLSALAAARRQDIDSLTFLLARRFPHHTRRPIGFLVSNLSRSLDIAS